MDSIVAIDIETTGLDPQKDSIIEIGAVRFSTSRIEDEWNSLINPGRKIPPFITQLTGINDHMVLEAPAIQNILPDLRSFVGDSPILGHNVGFDLAFLYRQGLFKANDQLDTYEIASVLLPTAGRYNLGSLGQQLNIPLRANHRALDDARVTSAVYRSLHEIGMQLPVQLLAELVRLGEGLDWAGYGFFYNLLRSRSKETISARQVRQGYSGPIFEAYHVRDVSPLTPNPQLSPLDPDEVASALEPGGIFYHHFPNYEHRPQQIEMLRAVTRALTENRHLLVEAGTGTGKSMAYLLPSALWAVKNGQRVVISTNTINLQDQLINKDIPDLCQAMGLNLSAAVMKGRSNYLCPRRLENMRRRGPGNADEIRVLGKVLVWLLSTNTGDRNELNLNGLVERDIWLRLSADDEGCTTENCIKRGGICPFYRARQAALAAHILIVNHALLLADVATGNRVLPEYNYLIVDEAHHLEEATTSALSFKTTEYLLDRAMRELGSPNSGALGKLIGILEGNVLPSDFAAINRYIQQATDLAFHFQTSTQAFFRSIEEFLFEQREGNDIGMYAHQERILPATRTQPAWADVEAAWEECDASLKPLVDNLAGLLQALGEIAETLPEEDDDTISNLRSLYLRLVEIQNNLYSLVFEPKPESIYWFEIQPNSRQISLNAAPLNIGPLMQKYLWNEKSAVILTSATLTTAGEFNYLKGRLYANEAYELAVGSPFDYETSVLLYIANDIPEPSDRSGHQRAVEQGILNLCLATGGKALVLFTSYDQLRRTYNSIKDLLSRKNIQVYLQGEGASASSLLENFKVEERAVLFGTRAFWEGVDVPGAALSVLVIVKLPFDVPSDPIVAARSETFEDPFTQYSLPEAILRFRQGFGRLIRTQSDRGIVAIFDRRIMSKRYGRLFTDSLPTCTTRVGPASELPKLAVRWLNL
ncbi:MAG: DNA polymerase III subunit epsilon [Anaerolineales bacterium]|nr:MAG: DNA polymerase III subunit epsilon [Anaerolineales bacterium]